MTTRRYLSSSTPAQVARPVNWVSEYFVPTTIPALNAADRNVYVDSSKANDSGNGLTEATAKKTLAAGVALLRDGHGDRLNLKCGGTYTGDLFPFTLSGHSFARPMIFQSYGTGARPILDTGGGTTFFQNAFETDLSHLWFLGLNVTDSTYDGTGTHYKGFVFTWQCSDILLENCYIHNFNFGVDMEGHSHGAVPGVHSHMRIRGCVIKDIYNTDLTGAGDWQNCSGIFVASSTDILIEQNILLDCGYHDETDGTTGKHGLYVHGECAGAVVKNNIQIGGDGFTVRCGGVITGNFLARTMSAIQSGMGDVATVGGITVTMEDNVAIEGMSYDALTAGAGAKPTIGFALGNIGGASSFSRNIYANPLADPLTQDVRAFWFRTPDDLLGGSELVVGAPLAFADNIFYKSGVFYGQERDTSSYTDITTYSGNDFQLVNATQQFRMKDRDHVDQVSVWSGNNYYAGGQATPFEWDGVARTQSLWDSTAIDASVTHIDTSATYRAPTRSLTDCAVSLGHASVAALKTALAGRSFANWNDNFTANRFTSYFRRCFA